MDFETRAIHVGQEPDPATGAVVTPIYQTSTFAQEAVGVHKGYEYARDSQPDAHGAQECLASLEGAAPVTRSRPGSARPDRSCTCSTRRTTSSASNDFYGGDLPACSRRCTSRRAIASRGRHDRAVVGSPTRRGDRGSSGSRRRPTRSSTSSTSRGRRAREGGRRPPRRRQHLRDAVSAATARPRRRHRAPLDDEVPRRPLRRRRRVRRGERPGRSPSACASSRSRSAPSRARSTRGSSCAASRRSRCGWSGTATNAQRDRRLPPRAPARDGRLLAGPADAPRARHRRPPDARLRRDGVVPPGDRGGGRRAGRHAPRSGRWPRASAASRA